jgi:transposase-like protein
LSAEYKVAMVAEYDALAHGPPERGALLRREGLYSSHISEWRRQRDAGGRDGLAKPRRAKQTAEQRELARLRARNAQLEADLERTKLALEITGKARALLGGLAESAATDRPST